MDGLPLAGDQDVCEARIEQVLEDGDSYSVVLRRSRHEGLPATRSTPRLEVRFARVKDVDAKREAGMVVHALVETEGEPPWRRFVFTSAEDGRSSFEVWARDVEWRDVERHPCPCCRFKTLDDPPPGSHEICPVCDWQDDDVQYRDPGFAAGPNGGRSLEQARSEFAAELTNRPGRGDELADEWGPRSRG